MAVPLWAYLTSLSRPRWPVKRKTFMLGPQVLFLPSSLDGLAVKKVPVTLSGSGVGAAAMPARRFVMLWPVLISGFRTPRLKSYSYSGPAFTDCPAFRLRFASCVDHRALTVRFPSGVSASACAFTTSGRSLCGVEPQGGATCTCQRPSRCPLHIPGEGAVTTSIQAHGM